LVRRVIIWCAVSDSTRQRALVERTSNGDEIALDELLGHFLPELGAFVRLHVGPSVSWDTPSDIVQSVCRGVLEDLSQLEYQGAASFKRLLFLRAKRKVVDRRRYHEADRRQGDRQVAFDYSAFAQGTASLLTPSRIVGAKDELDRFTKSLEALPVDHRRAILLCRGLGMSPTEAAEEMGKTPNAVRIALHRGLARIALLQRQMEREDS
jgi:RNA polymerase sigma-70 factor, ECF subfamily